MMTLRHVLVFAGAVLLFCSFFEDHHPFAEAAAAYEQNVETTASTTAEQENEEEYEKGIIGAAVVDDSLSVDDSTVAPNLDALVTKAVNEAASQNNVPAASKARFEPHRHPLGGRAA